jgi:hypothetical protein
MIEVCKMSKIGLIDGDGHNYPNLALMKISAYHKARGDTVDWHRESEHYDKVYQAKVFTAEYGEHKGFTVHAEEHVFGGTGYGPENRLPKEIEHMMPDYSLYGIQDRAYGFLSRGCPRGCPWCIVPDKEGRKSVGAADVSEWWNGQRNIDLLDPNLLACKDHMRLLNMLADTKAKVDVNQGLDCRLLTEDNTEALNRVRLSVVRFAWDTIGESEAVIRGLEFYAKHGSIQNVRRRRVYVLVNFDTSQEEDLYRLYKLRELNFDPYVMVYDKFSAPKETTRLQRWVNNKFVWRTCDRFEDYRPR